MWRNGKVIFQNQQHLFVIHSKRSRNCSNSYLDTNQSIWAIFNIHLPSLFMGKIERMFHFKWENSLFVSFIRMIFVIVFRSFQIFLEKINNFPINPFSGVLGIRVKDSNWQVVRWLFLIVGCTCSRNIRIPFTVYVTFLEQYFYEILIASVWRCRCRCHWPLIQFHFKTEPNTQNVVEIRNGPEREQKPNLLEYERKQMVRNEYANQINMNGFLRSLFLLFPFWSWFRRYFYLTISSFHEYFCVASYSFFICFHLFRSFEILIGFGLFCPLSNPNVYGIM